MSVYLPQLHLQYLITILLTCVTTGGKLSGAEEVVDMRGADQSWIQTYGLKNELKHYIVSGLIR